MGSSKKGVGVSERGSVLVALAVGGGILALMAVAAFLLLAPRERHSVTSIQAVPMGPRTLSAPGVVLTPPALPPFVPGIHADPSPLPDDLVAANGWRGRDGASLYEVWAGAAADDPAAGLVLYRTWQDGEVPGGLSFRPAPQGSGAVRVTAADGLLLTLEAEDGTMLHFEAATGRFV